MKITRKHKSAFKVVRCLVASLLLALLTVVYLSFHLPISHHSAPADLVAQPQQIRRRRNQEPRIAIIIPFAARQPGVVPYLSTFCKGAAGAAAIADFLIIHNGVIPTSLSECPSNVIFHNLESSRGMAERLARVVVSESSTNETAIDDELIDLLATYVKINPYGLVEFKPALGHIFADLITEYSHWGYSDLDILFGDLGRWVTPDELQNYDIVTYTYGDQHRLYLRGQFTFHKNDPVTINQLWRSCEYLTKLDERFRAILEQKQHYKTESAEGCYSAAVLERSDLRVKYAAGKAWTDTSEGVPDDGLIWSHGVYLTTLQSGRQILYRPKSAGDTAKKAALLGGTREDTGWNSDELLEKPMGAMEAINLRIQDVELEKNRCMYWVLPKYQSKLCLNPEDVTSDENVYWIDGELHKQRFEIAHHGLTKSGPLFHFQEWKRHYRFGQLASLHLSNSDVSTFLLTAKGAIPMPSSKKTNERLASPLGGQMKKWRGKNNEDFLHLLPEKQYCVTFELDKKSKKRLHCLDSITWRDSGDYISILSPAPAWKRVDVEKDVTLVLTLQISATQSSDKAALKGVVDHLTENLERWFGQPSISLIYMNGVTAEAIEYLSKRLASSSAFAQRHEAAFIAVIVDERGESLVSRKALMNMAIDTVPTRWYVSGLELERGLLLSPEMNFWAFETASAHSSYQGNVFWVPQFGLTSEETHHLIEQTHVLAAKGEDQVSILSEFDSGCDAAHSENRIVPKQRRVVDPLDSLWWDRTKTSLHNDSEKGSTDSATTETPTLQSFEREIMGICAEVAEDGNAGAASEDSNWDTLSGQDESPVLLIDNLVRPGVYAHELVRQVEELSGLNCYNILTLAQLVTIGYRMNVLPHSFAISTSASRKATARTTCRGCSGENDNKVREQFNNIVLEEIARAAEVATVWLEV